MSSIAKGSPLPAAFGSCACSLLRRRGRQVSAVVVAAEHVHHFLGHSHLPELPRVPVASSAPLEPRSVSPRVLLRPSCLQPEPRLVRAAPHASHLEVVLEPQRMAEAGLRHQVVQVRLALAQPQEASPRLGMAIPAPLPSQRRHLGLPVGLALLELLVPHSSPPKCCLLRPATRSALPVLRQAAQRRQRTPVQSRASSCGHAGDCTRGARAGKAALRSCG